MNKYSIEYDSHSLFLRQKSNVRFKERLEDIRMRKNNFLPDIINHNRVSKPTNTEASHSPKQRSLMDIGKLICEIFNREAI